jgi:hypothetical protein
MPARRAGGIDVNLIGEPGVIDEAPHDALRSGRTADIAETDKENAKRGGHE